MGKTALVVDADRAWQAGNRSELERLGYHVTVADTLAGARRSIRRRGPSAAVLETLTHGGFAYPLLAELRERCPGSNVAVVTSSPSLVGCAYARSLGARHLVKPVTADLRVWQRAGYLGGRVVRAQ